MAAAIASPPRAGASHAVFLLDLNGFKKINDVYGHGVGDDVLAVVGQRLRVAACDADMVARFGGDEFAILATLHGIDQFGVNSAPPARSELESTQIDAELLVAWVSEVRVSKTANIVLQVRYRRAGIESDPKIFRGATNSPAWTGSDEAMQQMLDEAMIKIVKGVAADLVESCRSNKAG
jgi:GGDEF domain-containing protein